MSLIADGRTALRTMLDNAETFSGIPERDWASAAMRLAKKQLTAARQTRADIIAIKASLGEDMFQRALDALSAYHVKILARKIDPNVAAETIESASMARHHIRTALSPGWESTPASPEPSTPASDAPKSNPYIGRKAFRTGR